MKIVYIILYAFIIVGCEKEDDPAVQPPPSIKDISPASGGANSTVTIVGANFSSNAFGNVVTFNGKAATIISGSTNTIIVRVPAGAGSGPVNVTVNGNSATGPMFTYIYTYTVTTIAGNGNKGFLNGNGINSQFNFPSGVAVDAQNNIYVADAGNNCIRKISSNGLVTTLAGKNIRGFADGLSDSSQFNDPKDVAVDRQGNVYVSDRLNFRIRKISSGFVTTLAGSGNGGFSDGSGANAKFLYTEGIAVDVQGNVYVVDNSNERIRKISPSGTVTTLAGNGIKGYVDGNGITAQFHKPHDVTIDLQGNAYVADYWNQRYRKITPNGFVSTFAGDGSNGYKDGNSSNAWFAGPIGAASDAEGNIFVTDESNQVIRKISSTGLVSTIAGTRDVTGFADGNASAAKFNYPQGLAVDQQGNIYVADSYNHCIRKISVQ